MSGQQYVLRDVKTTAYIQMPEKNVMKCQGNSMYYEMSGHQYALQNVKTTVYILNDRKIVYY